MNLPSSRSALILVPLLALAFSPRAPRAESAATTVVVVDLFHVLQHAKAFRKAEDDLRRWIDAEKKSLQTLSEEVDRRQAELKLFQPGDPEHVVRRHELELLQLRFKHAFDERERERTRRILANQRRSFEDARRAVAEAATGRNAGLVLQLRSGDPQGADPGELTSEIYLRDVLHHDAALDITPDVLRILDR